MEVINDLVGINNLKIYQNDDWFKFSLESVLLPYFVTLNLRCKKILDLCSGNAPIPIILSTRCNAKIIGVDIQKEVCELAQKSIKVNDLEDRISIINDNLLNLKKYFASDYFDVITVNPPFFKNNIDSCKNKDIHKTLARHELCVRLEDILQISFLLLKNGGYFAMVHRTERFCEILSLVQKYHLIPKKIQFIYSKKNSNSNLFMIECVKNGKDGVKFLHPLYVYNDDGSYTDEVKEMFNL